MAQFFVVLWKLTVSPNICCQLLRLTIVSTVGKISDNFQLCLSINPPICGASGSRADSKQGCQSNF